MKIWHKFPIDVVNFWLITIFGIVIMLDPANNYRLKIPFFGLALLGALLTINRKVNTLCYLFIVVGLLYTVYGLLICLIGGESISVDYQVAHIQLVFMSLLIIPMSRLSVDEILKMNYIVGLILATVINCLFLASSISPEFSLFLYQTNMDDQAIPTILISKRTFLGITIVAFFYKTAPFLFFASIYKFNHASRFRDYILAIFLIFPVFITGSRTPMLCGLCVLIYWLITTRPFSPRMKLFIISTFVVLGVTLIYFLMIDKSDGSAAVKGGNMMTYINDIFSPHGFLTGWGIGSEFMDVRGHLASHSEISYFDILRMWGLVFGSIYIIFLFYPVSTIFHTKNKDIKDYMAAYFLYLVLAGTNPFIFASTGWFIILTSYCILMKSMSKISDFNNNSTISHDLSLPGHI